MQVGKLYVNLQSYFSARDPAKIRYNLAESAKGHYTSDLGETPEVRNTEEARQRRRIAVKGKDGDWNLNLAIVTLRK